MAVDDLFRTLERRTEQDLYRMTFRMVASTQNELLQEIEANRKALMRRQIAKETLWFFASLAIGFLLGYAANEAISALAPGTYKTLLKFFGNTADYVFYFLCVLCFLGTYITRMTIWALQLL